MLENLSYEVGDFHLDLAKLINLNELAKLLNESRSNELSLNTDVGFS